MVGEFTLPLLLGAMLSVASSISRLRGRSSLLFKDVKRVTFCYKTSMFYIYNCKNCVLTVVCLKLHYMRQCCKEHHKYQ
ncbi:hypothetical protein PGIGA_G00182070 [Pangasianodon gigas]|uniref:Uncharacterized protein n=1 Tax=Pangasianodon gigas TaxID=30993 RepID=A0ACC5XWH1_PANGG|nr:hypothetical protein [Pangasianodon gigas]